VVNDEPYRDFIPPEMNAKYLNEIYKQVFGVDIIEIYLDRNIVEAERLIITDYSKNGFFWGQVIDDKVNC